MIILGLSPTAHESSVGLVIDGRIVAAASEERFTRTKNQGGFPHRAIRFVLEYAGIDAHQVDYVALAALPFAEERLRDVANFGRNLGYVASLHADRRSRLAHAANFARGMMLFGEWESWGGSERELRRELAALGVEDKLVYVDHHRAHVASAYFSSGFERCLGVSLDGYGSGRAGSFYLCEGGRLRLLASIPYPHSLGTFYRRVTQALGFQPNRHEGKVVGLAAFGDSSVLHDRVLERFDLTNDDFYRMVAPHDPFFERELAAGHRREDVAAAYQRVLEEVAVRYVRGWVERTGVSHVAVAGGVLANVKLNQRIAEIPGVRELFVFPAMGDGGVGVGAALSLAADLQGLSPCRLHDVYLGPDISDRDAEQALRDAGLAFERPHDLEQAVVEHLVAGRVVARCSGRMEFGPRALGNRSILYPAVDPTVNQWLNERLRRSEFMPFAPISLADEADALYERIDRVRNAARFMTVTVDCKARMKRESPAAVHVDGTSRPQLVDDEAQPEVARILRIYRERTGIPTLINTSFNMHEEPIVCGASDAVRAYLDGGLEVLALGPFLVTAGRS